MSIDYDAEDTSIFFPPPIDSASFNWLSDDKKTSSYIAEGLRDQISDPLFDLSALSVLEVGAGNGFNSVKVKQILSELAGREVPYIATDCLSFRKTFLDLIKLPADEAVKKYGAEAASNIKLVLQVSESFI